MAEPETKVLVAGFVPPRVREVIRAMASEEGRTVSNVLCRLLEQHPQIKKVLRERKVNGVKA